MCEKINSFNFLKSLFLKQRRQKIIYFRHIETEESMITKKKNYPTILIRIWNNKTSDFFLNRFSYKYRDDGRMKNKGEGSFSIFLPPSFPASLFNRG